MQEREVLYLRIGQIQVDYKGLVKEKVTGKMGLADIQMMKDTKEYGDFIEKETYLTLTDKMETDILDALAGYLRDRNVRRYNNMFFKKLFGKAQTKNETEIVQPRTDTETDSQSELQSKPQPKPEETEAAVKPSKPTLNQDVTFGRNGHGETAEVVLNDPEHNYRKVIVNYDGFFADFPGIVQGRWTCWLKGKFDFIIMGLHNYNHAAERS